MTWTIEDRIQRMVDARDIRDSARRRHENAAPYDHALYQEWREAETIMRIAYECHAIKVAEAYLAAIPASVETTQNA